MASIIAARLVCRAPTIQTVLRQIPKQAVYRNLSNDGRDALSRTARRQTLRERAMAPATDSGKYLNISRRLKVITYFLAFNVGRGAVAGGAVLGLGALCYYGLGLSQEAGALEKSM